MRTRRHPLANIPVPMPDPAAEAETVRQSVGLKARFLPVIGDYMAPTFESGDYAAVVPCSAYSGPGIYALDDGVGPVLWNAEKMIGADTIQVVHSNPRYTGHVSTMAEFNSAVIGKVFAGIHILDREPLAAREADR